MMLTVSGDISTRGCFSEVYSLGDDLLFSYCTSILANHIRNYLIFPWTEKSLVHTQIAMQCKDLSPLRIASLENYRTWHTANWNYLVWKEIRSKQSKFSEWGAYCKISNSRCLKLLCLLLPPWISQFLWICFSFKPYLKSCLKIFGHD